MNVTVYSTPGCVWCKRTKEFLKEYKVAFTEVDLSKDPKKAEEVMKKSGHQGVPIIEVNGTFIGGFDEEKLKEALKLNGKTNNS